MAVKRPDVRLRIDRLVLDGVDPVDPAALGRAVEAELSRLIAEGGSPFGTAATSIGRLDAGGVDWPGGSSDALGARVAGAVYSSLGGERQ
jgi:hypothetical protein